MQDDSIVCRIPMPRGVFTVVDLEDFERFGHLRWYEMRGYACRRINGRTTPLHRLIVDAPVGSEVDHIDGDRLNNRRENLRLCSHAENMMNRPKPSFRNCTSAYLGVGRRGPDRWHAQVWAGKKLAHFSLHETEVEAAKARDVAAIRLHGEFARLNFPG